MAGGEDSYDPFVDPEEEWGSPDYTPDGYNENLQVLGSRFVATPQNIETGLNRDGGSIGKMLEGQEKAETADLLVERDLWESMRDVGKAERENGWYVIDFYMEDNNRNYRGFLRPVDDLKWDVVMQEQEDHDIKVTNQPGLAGQQSQLDPGPDIQKDTKLGDYYGHFMPVSKELLN